MPATVEGCFQPDPDNLKRQILRNQSLTDGKNVGVVVFSRKACRFFIPAQRATHAVHLVCYHRFAAARTSEYNRTFTLPASDRLRRRSDEKRVIDRFLVERAEIFHLVPECATQLFHFLSVTKTGVICPKGNFHSPSLLDHTVECCREQDLELKRRAILPVRSRFLA